MTARIPICSEPERRRREILLAGRLRRLVLLAAGLILVGCTAREAPVVRCPVTRGLEEAAQLTRFKPGPGRDITDIVFEAAFAEITGTCEIDDDEIEVELKLVIVANRGPADTSREASFAFILAVVDIDRNFIVHEGKALRRKFNGQVEFPDNRTRVAYTDEFELTIPTTSGESADDFLIFISFELSADELGYNRGRLRR